MDLITLGLRLAFREPGCPICRLRQESERRYLFNLLYENVNDAATRLHLVHSQGFCPEHAWGLQAIEQQKWSDGMGTGIIYEDLTGRLLGILSDYLSQGNLARHKDNAKSGEHSTKLDRLRGWLERQGQVGHLLARLSASGSCRACEIADRAEETNLTWLVRQMADPEFRTLYATSDGLCLPHLRRALARAEDEETVCFLGKVAADKLTLLLADLREYGRKHIWQNRDEPKHPWEQASWVRAMAFFVGEAKEGADESVYRVRRQALADYHARPDMLAVLESADSTL